MPLSPHVLPRLLLPLLALAQAVQGCGGSCATLWYFWFGIFLALMIGFILLIVGVNFCLKRQRENKLIIRHFRISPQSDTSSDAPGLPRESTLDSQCQDVEQGSTGQQPDSDSQSDSSSPSLVSDVESLPDTQHPASRFRSISPRHFAFASPPHTSPTSLTHTSPPHTSHSSRDGGHSSGWEESRADQVTHEAASEHGVSDVPPSPLPPSLGATGELSRTLNLSSSGPILVVDTPRTGVRDDTS